MKTTKNTILITGGSAGIGLELAKLLTQNHNKVIITGRNQERLQQAAIQLPNVTTIASDVSKEADVNNLVNTLYTDFPDLNIVINNAGHALLYDITNPTANAFGKAADEMHTNYLSVIRLNEKLLPILKNQPEAAIVNVSSIVAFVPGALAGYSASKAALHSYTQSLRMALAETSAIKVFELMPPLVDTEFSRPIGGQNGISARAVAEAFVNALEKNEYEIRVGNTEQIYQLFRSSPEAALQAMNKSREQAQTHNS
ncbi:SDR family oxidoreductase [Adhaeribacter radiodurans]|uniref:SDR family NAD(P)-dependent oxidoreductase n=1 Tax=Adhaeribacter radiodurans TaxID=2745197 RepID=A0A7L7LDR2_9BACT|nr:SDR family NAD(P)-dependent oxidoreductase [Adhaeribacter radiodurans]QMU30897.1 SDR family NAD(P)-dependent oxidoreductase [Adhaeribacter radiodurans]